MSLRALRWGPGPGEATHLVALLHGVGASADDLLGLAPALAPLLPGVAFTAFDAPEPYDGAPFGRQWFSLQDRTPSALRAGAARATPVLEAALDAELARLGISSCALAGFSQGAMMALYAGLRRAPPPFAVLAYSGALLDVPPAAAHPPVLLVHGTEDEMVPPARSRDAERLLREADVRVEAVFRPGVGHWIDDPGLAAGAAFLRRALVPV